MDSRRHPLAFGIHAVRKEEMAGCRGSNSFDIDQSLRHRRVRRRAPMRTHRDEWSMARRARCKVDLAEVEADCRAATERVATHSYIPSVRRQPPAAEDRLDVAEFLSSQNHEASKYKQAHQTAYRTAPHLRPQPPSHPHPNSHAREEFHHAIQSGATWRSKGQSDATWKSKGVPSGVANTYSCWGKRGSNKELRVAQQKLTEEAETEAKKFAQSGAAERERSGRYRQKTQDESGDASDEGANPAPMLMPPCQLEPLFPQIPKEDMSSNIDISGRRFVNKSKSTARPIYLWSFIDALYPTEAPEGVAPPIFMKQPQCYARRDAPRCAAAVVDPSCLKYRCADEAGAIMMKCEMPRVQVFTTGLDNAPLDSVREHS